jgi:hypothetical protein
MPILHFSGKFRYQPPFYNNEPANLEVPFDKNMLPSEVHKNVTNGVEPLEYFEFEFYDVRVRKITYDDCTSANNRKRDPLVSKKIILKGLLVDTAPHLERGRLFAGEIRVIDFILGKMETAVQSDVFTSIRKVDVNDVSLYSAYFESKLYDMYALNNEFVSSRNSRFIRESQSNNLKIYFNLNNFNLETLEGEVFGYIGPFIPTQNPKGLRIQGRRLLINSKIRPQLTRDFRINKAFEESEDIFRQDLESTYEILETQGLLILRYINSIPFLDTSYRIPEDYKFLIVLLKNGRKISSNYINVSHKELQNSGGIFVLSLPKDIDRLEDLSTSIMASKDTIKPEPFMSEPEYDLVIDDNNQKFLILESGRTEELGVKVYKHNKLSKDSIQVTLETQVKNKRSPIVVWWVTRGSGEKTSSNFVKTIKVRSTNGLLTCEIQARNLEHSEKIEDPVSATPGEMVSGDLAWDRYYGNYVSLKLGTNNVGPVKLSIPVRVLHSVPLERLRRDLDELKNPVIVETINKMLSYYTRYYPWIHVRYLYTQTITPQLVYDQFLKINEFLAYIETKDLDNWSVVQESISNINHFLDRLVREDDDWKKMPRSRDFPFNGVEFLKTWKGSISDKLILSINEAREKVLKSEPTEFIPDMDKWGDVQELIKKIDHLMNHLSNDDKKLISLWKLQIFDKVIEELNASKTQTRHSHNH